jgi:hypothetical protein
MGRLTLNVLLSFAQFEREVTSERIRDKIAASKRKGLWVGGMVPLGYESRDRKLTVVEEKAERVRTIFRRYLELGSLNLLLADLRKSGIVTKARCLRTGRSIGGTPFSRDDQKRCAITTTTNAFTKCRKKAREQTTKPYRCGRYRSMIMWVSCSPRLVRSSRFLAVIGAKSVGYCRTCSRVTRSRGG